MSDQEHINCLPHDIIIITYNLDSDKTLDVAFYSSLLDHVSIWLWAERMNWQ